MHFTESVAALNFSKWINGYGTTHAIPLKNCKYPKDQIVQEVPVHISIEDTREM